MKFDFILKYFNKKYRTYEVNGITMVEPYPFFGVILVLTIFTLIVAYFVTEVNVVMLIKNFSNIQRIVGSLFNPNWSFFPQIIDPLLETIKIAISSTIIGGLCAFPVAILSSSNLVKNKYVYNTLKYVMSLIRTIPLLVYAAIFIFIFGLGVIPGIVAMSLFTFTIVTKMFYERIETVNMKAYEAIESTGAKKIQSFRAAIIPEISGPYFSIVLYTFEINIRSASILGFIGAGGIGVLLDNRIAWRRYDDVGMILLVFFVTIFTIESASRFLRKRFS